MTRPEPRRYAHAEAYALMTYRSDDGTETEQLFNSRDGVTPFVITLRSGKTATHADWHADTRMPEDWTPPPGMRYFTDLTADRARELAASYVTSALANPADRAWLLDTYGTAGDAIDHLTADYLTPGAPDLIDPAPPPETPPGWTYLGTSTAAQPIPGSLGSAGPGHLFMAPFGTPWPGDDPP